MEGATCLGDVLAAHGYNTVPTTGADVNFGGKGTFHASHGFVERLGFNALKARAGAATQQTWGREHGEWEIEDEALFALARAKVDELANQAEPFALVLAGFVSRVSPASDGGPQIRRSSTVNDSTRSHPTSDTVDFRGFTVEINLKIRDSRSV